jgi:hypothetical protein
MIRRPLAERIRAKLVPGEGGCLLWVGYVDKQGIPKVSDRGRQVRLQRAAWQLSNGRVPRGMVVLACPRDPRCAHVDHLSLVSKGDVCRDNLPELRVNAAKRFCPAGHPYDRRNTYTSKAGERHCRACIRERMRRTYWAKKAL